MTSKKLDSKIEALLGKIEEVLTENKELRKQVEDLRQKVEAKVQVTRGDKEVLLHSIQSSLSKRSETETRSLKDSLIFEKTIDALLECEKRGVFDKKG